MAASDGILARETNNSRGRTTSSTGKSLEHESALVQVLLPHGLHAIMCIGLLGATPFAAASCAAPLSRRSMCVRRPFSRARPYACLYVRTLYLPCGGPGLALEDVVVLESPFDSLDFFQALRPRRCGSFALEPALG